MAKRHKPAPAAHDDLLAAPAHTHGPNCAHCGNAMQRSVEVSLQVNDRLLQTLVLALAKQQGLRAAREGQGVDARLVVEGPDDATMARFEARAEELCAKLDAELMAVTRAFVRAHTGVELAAPKGG